MGAFIQTPGRSRRQEHPDQDQQGGSSHESKSGNSNTLSSAALCAATASNTQTTPSGENPAPLENAPPASGGEIVVTALKRKGTIQSAPLSVSALGQEQLTQMGATQLQDYFRQIPNVNVAQGVLGQSRISISMAGARPLERSAPRGLFL